MTVSDGQVLMQLNTDFSTKGLASGELAGDGGGVAGWRDQPGHDA